MNLFIFISFISYIHLFVFLLTTEGAICSKSDSGHVYSAMLPSPTRRENPPSRQIKGQRVRNEISMYTV